LNKDRKIHKIGIDLDNTIICYDTAFRLAAQKFGLIGNDTILSKESLCNQIRRKENGEKQWQKLQGYVYGKGISNAEIFPGFYRFLWRCYQNNVKVEIVSHKTKYGHFDTSKTPLRSASNDFLSDKNIINNNIQLIRKITYTDTLTDKLDYIRHSGFDWFIDDLVKMVDPMIAKGQKSILFSPNSQMHEAYSHTVNSWEEIENLLFGQLTLDEVQLLAEELPFDKNFVKNVAQLKGRGNSSVYKILTAENSIFFKVYPQTGKHDRLGSEFCSTKTLNDLGMNEIQKPIASNKELNIAAYEWINVNNTQIFDIDAIEKSLQFLKKLHSKRSNHLFDNFSMASDSCISILSIENQIKRRLLQLQKSSKGFSNLNEFLKNDFIPIFTKVISWSKLSLTKEQDYSKMLNKKELTLSPSDFGFHNMMFSESGNLRFIDFEYFGWDDPVKLISDFSHHAGMNLTKEMEDYWFSGVKNIYGEHILNRLQSSWPLYGLNWCLIILNEFKVDVWNKRCLANQEKKLNRKDVLLDQLTKSRNKLEYISECYIDKEFW